MGRDRLDPNSEVLALTEALEALIADRSPLGSVDPALKKRFLSAAGRVGNPDHKDRRALNRQKRRDVRDERRDADKALLDTTRIRQARANPIFETPRRRGEAPQPSVSPGELSEDRTCYVCRAPYRRVHPFYDQMCCECGDFNYEKRYQEGDLTGRIALITGARVKIGYQASIFLLRAGCTVHATTRFPRDAARRYAAEPDFADWQHRLVVHGVDLRHTPSVEALAARLLTELPRLDLLINNACQTVRRPAGFYQHLIAGETEAALLTDASSALLSQVALLPEDHGVDTQLFPAGRLDADLQQVDLRRVNSWRLKLAEVPTIELLEVHLVNAVAPFVLNARLKPLMAAVPTRDAHIVNVSAMEGQFYRTHKSDRHPHTNMAKAALNMLTRTSAMDYIEAGIHMNSVDTGWVTDEDPMFKAEEKVDMHDFSPPLDIVDGAARIVDPFFSAVAGGPPVWGQFLKDYKPTDW